jgi:hypothetical protein
VLISFKHSLISLAWEVDGFLRAGEGVFRGVFVGVFRGVLVGVFRGVFVGVFRGVFVGVFRVGADRFLRAGDGMGVG